MVECGKSTKLINDNYSVHIILDHEVFQLSLFCFLFHYFHIHPYRKKSKKSFIAFRHRIMSQWNEILRSVCSFSSNASKNYKMAGMIKKIYGIWRRNNELDYTLCKFPFSYRNIMIIYHSRRVRNFVNIILRLYLLYVNRSLIMIQYYLSYIKTVLYLIKRFSK